MVNKSFTKFCFDMMGGHKAKPGPKPKAQKVIRPPKKAKLSVAEKKAAAALLSESLDKITRRYMRLDDVRAMSDEQLREMFRCGHA